MAQGGFLVAAVLQHLVVDDVVAAHQACQVEGLGGSVQSHGAHFRVLADGLGRHMLVTGEKNVTPNFVGYHHHIVLPVQLHGLFHFPLFPDAAAGVVGRAENGGVDLVLHDLLLHVFKVHAPHAVFVLHQGGMDDVVAVVGQTAGETHVGGRVQQHIVALGTEHIQRGDHAAQDAVFVTDVGGGQAGNAVVGLLPLDDGAEVFLGRHEIAKGGMLGPLDHSLLNGGNHGEVHVGDPHGDDIKTLLRSGIRGAGRTDHIHSNGISALTVYNGSKIVFHGDSPFLAYIPIIKSRAGNSNRDCTEAGNLPFI